MMKQSDMNTFVRTYFDPYKKRLQGEIHFDGNTCDAHNRLITEICLWARNIGLAYFTRVYLKGGEIVDICIPELPRPFIEVRHSELKKVKEYLTAYDDKRIFIDTTDPWRLT